MTGATIGVNGTVDTVTYNNYWTVVGNAGAQGQLQNVVDYGEGLQFDYLTTWQVNFGPFNQCPRSIRFMTDSDKFAILLNGNAPNQAYQHGFRLYVNGVPATTTPSTPTATGATLWHTVTFPTAKPRLIEVRTSTYFGGVYVPKPYQVWKPRARKGPRTLIIGDSWTSNASVSANNMNSAYWDIGKLIGSEDVWIDHYGGTGYTVTHAGDGGGTAGTSYLSRVTENKELLGQTWNLQTINPEVVVIHGGGANDKFKGKTNAQVIDGVVATFETLRTRLPNAKLIFVEGMRPPGFAAYAADYPLIRDGAQAQLTDTGVYFINTTTPLWFDGIGNASAPNADGKNANNYIISDGYHKNDAGHLYLRRRIAPKITQIIQDDGELLNTVL
jgi:lysophospholipase L1-like esterase